MTTDHGTSLASDYERCANALLQSGQLGHGIQEDLLIASAAWFHQPLVPEAGTFADFFAAASAHHVTLLCAVDLDPSQAGDAADFHDFLTVVLTWIRSMPVTILRKSPVPLGLVIGWMGTGYNMGAQIMRSGGPAIIYWGVFRSLRNSLDDHHYKNLSEQIRQTLVHELIGHQLAFCTVGGPLLSREDMHLIFQACGVSLVKLAGSASVAVEDFLAADDLLAAISRIEYYSSPRDSRRYHSNITERIAFSIQGNLGETTPPYNDILGILKCNLLRVPAPLTPGDCTVGPLYEGYDFSRPDPSRYFIVNVGGQWRETEAMWRNETWINLEQLCVASQQAVSRMATAPPHSLAPGQELLLTLGDTGYLLDVEGVRLLASPFGILDDLSRLPRQPCHDQVEPGRVTIDVSRGSSHVAECIAIRNRSQTSITYALEPLSSSRRV